jgi:hypothetical protein
MLSDSGEERTTKKTSMPAKCCHLLQSKDRKHCSANHIDELLFTRLKESADMAKQHKHDDSLDATNLYQMSLDELDGLYPDPEYTQLILPGFEEENGDNDNNPNDNNKKRVQ